MTEADIALALREGCKTCTREAEPGSDFCDWCEDIKCPACKEPMGAQRTRLCPECVGESTARCFCGAAFTFDEARANARFWYKERYGDYWLVHRECPRCLGALEQWTDVDGEAAPEALEHLIATLMSRHRRQINIIQLEDAINER